MNPIQFACRILLKHARIANYSRSRGKVLVSQTYFISWLPSNLFHCFLIAVFDRKIYNNWLKFFGFFCLASSIYLFMHIPRACAIYLMYVLPCIHTYVYTHVFNNSSREGLKVEYHSHVRTYHAHTKRMHTWVRGPTGETGKNTGRACSISTDRIQV